MRAWRARRAARRAASRAAAAARQVGLLPYAPERWTSERWTAAYDAGDLVHYASLPELARYSVLLGYVGWVATHHLAGAAPAVLDIGCGRGLLRERMGSTTFASYVGVDVSPAAVAAASSRGFDRSTFVVGDAARVELEPADVVVLNEVLYYADDPARFLERVAGFVRPGGVVLLSVWRHPGDRALWRLVDAALDVVDVVEVRDRANGLNRRGWRVAMATVRDGRRPAS